MQVGQVVLSGVIPATQATMMSVSESGGGEPSVDVKDVHTNKPKHDLHKIASGWGR